MNRLRPLLVVVIVALAISLAGCGSLGINGNNAAAPPTTDN